MAHPCSVPRCASEKSSPCRLCTRHHGAKQRQRWAVGAVRSGGTWSDDHQPQAEEAAVRHLWPHCPIIAGLHNLPIDMMSGVGATRAHEEATDRRRGAATSSSEVVRRATACRPPAARPTRQGPSRRCRARASSDRGRRQCGPGVHRYRRLLPARSQSSRAVQDADGMPPSHSVHAPVPPHGRLQSPASVLQG